MEKQSTMTPASIAGLSHEGRGITYINGKTTFIQDALPGETVLIQSIKKHRQYEEAKSIAILKASPDHATSKCTRYSSCGGCSLQHLSIDKQLQHKENVLREQLLHIAGLQPQAILSPLKGLNWGYWRRARLGVKYVAKKQALLVGFREKNSRYLAQLQGCETLAPQIGQLIIPLQHLIGALLAFQAIPQIEAALGDETLALVFRHLTPCKKRILLNSKILRESMHYSFIYSPETKVQRIVSGQKLM